MKRIVLDYPGDGFYRPVTFYDDNSIVFDGKREPDPTALIETYKWSFDHQNKKVKLDFAMPWNEHVYYRLLAGWNDLIDKDILTNETESK